MASQNITAECRQRLFNHRFDIAIGFSREMDKNQRISGLWRGE